MRIRAVFAAAALAAAFPFALDAFAADAPAAAPAPAARDARLTQVKGRVLVYEPGSSEPVAAETGLPLAEGDRVHVPSGSTAEITLDGESVIRLTAGSDFTLGGLQRSSTWFSLSLGSLLAKIKTLTGGEKMEFRGPNAVAAVRGTELGVDAEAAETRVGVFDEGRVEVSNPSGTQTLGPSQETRAAQGAAPAAPGALDRFKDRRAEFKALRKRFAAAPKHWKALSAERREQRRKEALERGRRGERERGEERRERREERRQAPRRERRRGGK